jgi:hypothetical protein
MHAKIVRSWHQWEEEFKRAHEEGDKVFVCGYVRGGDNRPYAVIADCKTGVLGMCPLYSIVISGFGIGERKTKDKLKDMEA